MREFLLNCTASEIILFGLLFFFAVYFVVGGITSFLSLVLMPAVGIGYQLDPRPVSTAQFRREISLSLVSIFIFGAGLIFPWGLVKMGWARLAIDPPLTQTLVEIVALVIWNEIHFYINHRLLHTRFLRRFHLLHHRSLVTTPWTAYSFHPIETMMLGSVLLLPMLVHDFSVYALAFIPLFSLLVNSMGHANYDFHPNSQLAIFAGVRRHQLHHACFHGNYGFLFPFMDMLAKTILPSNAAAKQLQQWETKRSISK